MNAHFAVINKRGAITAGALVFLSIVLFSVSAAQFFSGGSKFWLVPLIIFVILFILAIMILVSVLTAGVDIRDGVVIMPDLDPSKGKQPKFRIGNLQDIRLRNGEGQDLNPATDSLLGARIVFLLSDGDEEIYYPVGITPAQFEKLKNGMLSLARL